MKATWNNLDKKIQFYKLCSTDCTTTLTRRDLIPAGKRKEVMNYFKITESKKFRQIFEFSLPKHVHLLDDHWLTWLILTLFPWRNTL